MKEEYLENEDPKDEENNFLDLLDKKDLKDLIIFSEILKNPLEE